MRCTRRPISKDFNIASVLFLPPIHWNEGKQFEPTIKRARARKIKWNLIAIFPRFPRIENRLARERVAPRLNKTETVSTLRGNFILVNLFLRTRFRYLRKWNIRRGKLCRRVWNRSSGSERSLFDRISSPMRSSSTFSKKMPIRSNFRRNSMNLIEILARFCI